ncbi:hypothetical protein ALI22I_20300 [Saccharothrix sp. ALI-22-I]|uniref:hypothetical protein n=1 Tax=Saccharothrix sp. ALI-22-I TaxID=1933778 RepID=UPI00097C6D18|nr:hypothetical protein [Saccharothrix sp. ALI-22-I]ONI88082.1 hypothetical protein ALI22I_20300 [Saccharothrix sp. ALI-22-I]
MSTDPHTAAPGRPAPNTADADAGRPTASTYVRNEFILGPIHVVALPEQELPDRVTRDFYELNVIDGWVRRHEWTDESGVAWLFETTTRSHVGAVLDAAPEHFEFIVGAHLRWIAVLDSAKHRKRAQNQWRALMRTLARHGLELVPVSSAG